MANTSTTIQTRHKAPCGSRLAPRGSSCRHSPLPTTICSGCVRNTSGEPKTKTDAAARDEPLPARSSGHATISRRSSDKGTIPRRSSGRLTIAGDIPVRAHLHRPPPARSTSQGAAAGLAHRRERGDEETSASPPLGRARRRWGRPSAGREPHNAGVKGRFAARSRGVPVGRYRVLGQALHSALTEGSLNVLAAFGPEPSTHGWLYEAQLNS
jgi:hypothetical protein